jgi:hypothetical protein
MEGIENKFPVSNIYYNGTQIWSFLRLKYWTAIQAKELGFDRRKCQSLVSKIKLLKNIFYGWRNIFKKYDFLAFSNSSYRRNIAGLYCDRFIDPVIDKIGKNRVLLIELTTSNHYKRKNITTKNIISDLGFRTIAYLMSKIKVKKYSMTKIKTLELIENDYHLNIDYKKLTWEFFVSCYVRSVLLRIFKPKAVFVVCYSSFIDVVYAAKKLGIPVIELQHGVIGKIHPTYNIRAELDRQFSPDYLLSFGENEIVSLADSKFISTENIIPVGNAHLELSLNYKGKFSDLEEWKSKYEKCICFTGQEIFEKDILSFINKAAIIDPDIGYVYIPRDWKNTKFINCEMPSNVFAFPALNFYQIVGSMDFHSTVCSTCALEAPSLGVQNILVNIKGYSRKYFGDILTDVDVSSFVDTPEEFVNNIREIEVLDREDLIERNDYFFLHNYNANIDKFLEEKLCGYV